MEGIMNIKQYEKECRLTDAKVPNTSTMCGEDMLAVQKNMLK